MTAFLTFVSICKCVIVLLTSAKVWNLDFISISYIWTLLIGLLPLFNMLLCPTLSISVRWRYHDWFILRLSGVASNVTAFILSSSDAVCFKSHTGFFFWDSLDIYGNKKIRKVSRDIRTMYKSIYRTGLTHLEWPDYQIQIHIYKLRINGSKESVTDLGYLRLNRRHR